MKPKEKWIIYIDNKQISLSGKYKLDYFFVKKINKCHTVKRVLCDHLREQCNMVTYDRWSLNTGLIDLKYNVKGNKN